MTERERSRLSDLEQAVIDRERRIFSLSSLIRAMNRGEDPGKACVDLQISPDEARILGVLNYAKAAEIRQEAG